MARRDYRQLNLAESLLGSRKSKHDRLDRLHDIHELIAWEPVDALLGAINSAQKGADGYPPLCLFKALLLSETSENQRLSPTFPGLGFQRIEACLSALA